MAVILLPIDPKGAARFLNRRAIVWSLAALLLVIPALALYAGYYLGLNDVSEQQARFSTTLRAELQSQRSEIDLAKKAAQEDLNALTIRLAELQSRVVRLDALGERLTEMADIDAGEFDFRNVPALGGPNLAPESMVDSNLDGLFSSFDELSIQLNDREQQLDVLESLLMSRSLEDEVFPAGFPAEKGWLSSHFGMRTDPFSGRKARHEGVDIAGKMGSNILSVGAGVVTWSGERYGYGQLVEINHGNGYVTRYAHNKENLVAAGDTVKKGQVVALMGSSGRSTGPHVHFEVLRNGVPVNPVKYVRAGRN